MGGRFREKLKVASFLMGNKIGVVAYNVFFSCKEFPLFWCLAMLNHASIDPALMTEGLDLQEADFEDGSEALINFYP